MPDNLRQWLNTRTGRLVQHDALTGLGAAFLAWQAAGESWSWAAIGAAAIVGLRVVLRTLRPVPGRTTPIGTRLKTSSNAGTVTVHVHADTSPFRAELDKLAKDLTRIAKR